MLSRWAPASGRYATASAWGWPETSRIPSPRAAELGVSLEKYSDLGEGVPSPIESDRCTVFTERGINHYPKERDTPCVLCAKH